MSSAAKRAISCGGEACASRRRLCLFAGNPVEVLQRLTAAPVTVVLATAALLLQLQHPLQSVCEFWFADFAVSTVPQLLVCHLLHWSWDHFLWDAAVFVAAGVLCERRWRARFHAVLAASAVLIPLLVAVSHPELLCYRGLSGLDSALFALAAGRVFVEEAAARRWLPMAAAGIAVAGQFVKIAMEVQAGETLFVNDMSFTPVPLAHLTGALLGTGAAFWCERDGVRGERGAVRVLGQRE
jgi:rhomboid family GlyGly-CTERM serine protease